MPQHFRLSGGSSIEATPRIVRGPEGAVEGVLLTISDVTALEAARHDAQENAALVTILRNRRGFIDFLSDAREELLLVRDAVSAPDGQTLARRLVHTLKGNAGCFGLTEVQALVHEIEEAPTLLPVHAHQIEEAIRGFLARHQSVLAMDWDSQQAPAVAVPAVQLAELRRNAECGDVAAVRTWVERVQLRPAAEMMGPLDRMVAGIAQRLGKDVEFKIVGEQQRVEPNQTRPIFRNLGHLLRNAIDHGIEVPSARGAKPATATLHLELAVDANGLQIVVRDDGRGIDGQRLLERAISRGLIDGASAKALTYDDCVELVFLDGLSSADQATEFSGRGVGMSAVRAAVRQAGGRIHVRSRCGVGTEVTIRVPNARVVDCPATHPANDAVDLSRTQPHCGFADT